ncbi:MAG: translocation/assembly module TamB domain-containing protein, partial [Flavobacteriales bacterium]|nr:translocation/assembly module TamB domain-containing protein [Flavobacteriales bacterium]
ATGPKLEGQLKVLRVVRDSMHLDDLLLEATNAPGALRTSLRLRDGEVDRYRIGLDLRRQGEVPVLHVLEDLVLDRKPWQASAGNALFLDPGGIRAEDFMLSNGDQRLELRTVGDGTHLDIAEFDLAALTGLIRTQDSLAIMRGTLDGTVLLPVNAQQHLNADLRLSGFHLMDVELGSLNVQVNEETKDRYRSTIALDADRNQLSAEVLADMSHTEPHITLDGELDLDDLSLFSPFVKSYVFELGGALNGPLEYSQVGNDVKMRGQVAVTDGRIGLIQTGAVYRIPHDTVIFDEQGLSFTDFALLDARDNRFHLDGHVITTSTPRLDLRLRTDRFQLVNSTIKENPMFYGKLFSSIDLHIGGTVLTPSMKGSLGVLDSTDLSMVLPGSRVELVDHSGIVQFTTDFDAQDTLSAHQDSEMLRDSLAAQLPGVDLDLRIALDRNARFNVVIDPTTGDQATFRGEADLLFRYNPEGDMNLQGPFTVVDGGYTVEFYGLVKKRFELVPGGKIVWDGDPLTGRMDVQAKYSTTAAPYPLVANARGGLTESERNSLQARLPFDVLINIKDAVQEPTISFGLDMERQVRNSYPQVNSVLDQLAKPANQEELNRQVFGLLVLSTFIENENGTEQGGSSLASTAARNSVNSILTQQLNRLTGQGIKGMDIQLGVNTYDQTEGGESYARTTVDYKVTQRILNDRVSIEAGGSMGADERKQDVSSVSNTRAPQYAIAYDITKDGRLRLRAYHENAYDLYDGELVNNGVALMITRDFEQNARERERLRQEILKRRQAEQNKDEKK